MNKTTHKAVCFQLQHNYYGQDDWQDASTCLSSNKWMWDLLMGRLKDGETDPREGSHRLQPVISDKHDWIPVAWETVTMSPSGDFFLK
jgi:hypothetical protein